MSGLAGGRREILAAALGAAVLSAASGSSAQNCHMEHYATGDGGTVDNLVCDRPNRRGGGGGGAGYSDRWAAIAVSNTRISWGSSWQQPSQASAERVALADCNRAGHVADCQVAQSARNYCLALATSPTDHMWGADRDRNGRRAREGAMGYCRRGGGRACAIVADPCSHD